MSMLSGLMMKARAAAESVEDLWFDTSRHVRTAGNLSLRFAGIPTEEIRDGELYVPARAANVRSAILATGIRDFENYSFVDLGSGRGRSLFVAAEFPFRQIVGVEYGQALHEDACANARRFQTRRQRCSPIHPVHANARDFTFPPGKLLVYLFNPFGADTMQHVVRNLQLSLLADPRETSVVLLWPKWGHLFATTPGMRLHGESRRYQIYSWDPARQQHGEHDALVSPVAVA